MKRTFLFFAGLALLAFSVCHFPIVKAQTTYYLRADGTAANKGAATGPCSNQSACMSIATHDGETFSAGGTIVVCDDGGTYRDQMDIPSNGSSGNHILYQREIGGNPIISGSDLVSTWTVYSGNVWQATISTEPKEVWMNGAMGSYESGGTGALNIDKEWYWASNILYQYSTSDPDTRYTAPGTEASQRDNAILADNKDYLTFDGLTLRHAERAVMRIEDGTDVIIQNMTVHSAGSAHGRDTNGICVGSCNNVQLLNNTIYDIYWNNIEAAGSCSSVIIDGNKSYGTRDHHGIDVKAEDFYPTQVGGSKIVGDVTGAVIKFNYVYDNVGGGIYLEDDDEGHISSPKIHNNLIDNQNNSSGDARGIWIKKDEGTEIDGALVYNNTIYKSRAAGIQAEVTTSNFKNNIISQSNQAGGTSRELWVHDGGGAANTADYNCIDANYGYACWDGTCYADLNAFNSATGQGANDQEADPLFTDTTSGDFTLQATSPAIDAGVNLGASYDDALDPASIWPDEITTQDQDDFGSGWEIGAYVFKGVGMRRRSFNLGYDTQLDFALTRNISKIFNLSRTTQLTFSLPLAGSPVGDNDAEETLDRQLALCAGIAVRRDQCLRLIQYYLGW